VIISAPACPAAATAKAKHVVDTYTTTEGVVKAHIDNSVQRRVDALNAMLGEGQRQAQPAAAAAAASCTLRKLSPTAQRLLAVHK
jgi:hypothetical protein